MNDNQLERYSRQIMMDQIDLDGQGTLLQSTAVIFGLGGLGSVSSLYLASSGIGHLILIDNDVVELSNLQRQIVHKTESIGMLKVNSASKTLLENNPGVKITTVTSVDEKNIREIIDSADIVLDGTDNLIARYMINKACVDSKKVLVSASVIKMEGQVSVFRGHDRGFPCYQCVYSGNGLDDNTCINNGILAPVVGIIGSIQAVEAIKVLLGIGTDLSKKMVVVDAMTMAFDTINIKEMVGCIVCGK